MDGDSESLDTVAVKAILADCSQQYALFEPYDGYLSICKEHLTQSVCPEEIILNKKVGVTPLIRLLMLNGCKNRRKIQ